MGSPVGCLALNHHAVGVPVGCQALLHRAVYGPMGCIALAHHAMGGPRIASAFDTPSRLQGADSE